MRSIERRLTRLEQETGANSPRIFGVWFVDAPEKAHTPAPDQERARALWGNGPDTWRIYIKPGQSEDDALRQAGIDPDRNLVLKWGHA